jgi:hypothetical protein
MQDEQRIPPDEPQAPADQPLGEDATVEERTRDASAHAERVAREQDDGEVPDREG